MVGVALFAPAATAHAVPFTIATGADVEDPSVAVDENGIGHFAWTQEVPFVSNANDGPDVVHYCQIPRNGKACTVSRSFTLPNDDFQGPKVLLHPDGRILIVDQRCCGDNPRGDDLDVLWLIESADGGNTWSAPRAIGTQEPSGDAIVGPGEFSISVISSVTTGGTFFQRAPLDSYTEAAANVGDAGRGVNNPSNNGTVAYIDPLTPIAVMSDLERVYFRKWGGAGDYNDLGTWGPITEIGPGSEPEAVGGKRGVFVAYKTADFPRQYRVARWGGMAFGSSTAVTPKASPNEADFFQDNGGGLHFVWQENEDTTLKHRLSRDGTTWTKAETLTPENDFAYYNVETATARDGGGWAVWDGNGQGPIEAVQYGPTGAVSDPPEGNPDCPEELKVGSARLVARDGCFQKQKGTDQFTTTGDVRVNGMDIYTPGGSGSSARSAAKVTITIDKSARTLITKGGKVEARVGNVVLGDAALEWKLPSGEGVIQDLAGNPAPFDTGKFDIEFLGLKVLGQTQPKLLPDGSVEIPVHLALPEPLGGLGGLGGVTGDITLKATVADGLKLSNLHIHADHVGLGIAEISPLDIDYIGDPSKLYGKVNLLLPVIESALETEFQFTDGSFDYGKAELTLPGQGIAVATGVFLKKINFGIFIKPKPTKITGGVQVNALGTFGDTPVLEVDGQVSYTFPNAPAPGIFRVEGNASLIGIPFADAFAQYETSGKISFGGGVEVGDESILGISGGAEGEVDVNTLKFNILGSAHVCAFTICAFGSEVLLNNARIAGCVGGSTLGAGARFEFSDKSLHAFWTCNLAKYKIPLTAKVSQGGPSTVKIKGGQKLASIQIVGTGGSPRVTVTGPSGQTIVSPDDGPQFAKTDSSLVLYDAASSSTIVNLSKPEAGTWTITPQATSVPIASVRTANALPDPKVKAVVKGKGHKRTIRWTVKKIAGQKVRLSEEGPGAFKNFGELKGGKGTIKFYRQTARRANARSRRSSNRTASSARASWPAPTGRPARRSPASRGVCG